MKHSTGALVLGAVNLLVGSAPALAYHQAAPAGADQNVESLNAASLKSMESSWLKLPPVCKAKSFNADAAPLASHQPSQQALQIYSVFALA
jgi:hypothetical protein